MMARPAWNCRSIGIVNCCTVGAGRFAALALVEADERKAQYLREGGVLLA
jgi:hypothetical protein